MGTFVRRATELEGSLTVGCARGGMDDSIIERVATVAQRLLIVAIDDSTNDRWLWEHAERVMNLAQLLVALPELKADEVDRTALATAALFHDAGWTVELHQGKWKRWQLLGRPTNDIQRELGAVLLQEEVGHHLPAASARQACEAIRQCNNRQTELVEARILAEAETLDEMGTMYLLRQFRQYQAEGRPLQQLYDTWQRQKEYHYWDLRLNEGFQYETVRALARQRLETLDRFMQALGSELHSGDVRQQLAAMGVTVAPEAM